VTITAHQGPLGAYGQGTFADSNPDAGPSFFYQGNALLDPRTPFTYQPGLARAYAWAMTADIPIIDQSPSTASATNIAAAQAPTAGTALTLVSSSGSGITVGCKVVNANTGALVTGLLGIDVAAARTITGVFTNGSPKITFAAPTMQGVQVGDQVTFTSSGTLPTGFALLTTYYVVAIGNLAMMVSATPGGSPISAGSAGSGTQTINVTAPNTYDNEPNVPFQPPVVAGALRLWNPSWSLSRCLVVTTVGNDSSGTYTINGYDIYGYPMTQVVTGPNATTGNTTKAFKYIASVVPGGTLSGSNVSIGTVDLFGLPLRADTAAQLTFWYNNAVVQPPTTFNAADINTATGTTGDVRGTVYGGAASDGTKRYTAFWSPLSLNMNSTVGLLGQPQF
jgi:hypothetical protein